MRRIAALLCIGIMLISSAALAKPSANEQGNRERTPRVREHKPKDKVGNSNHGNRRTNRYTVAKPHRRTQHVQADKPRNRNGRHYIHAQPRRKVRYVNRRSHTGYRSPLFSLLHWHFCSHRCH